MSSPDMELYIWFSITAVGRFENTTKTIILSQRPLPVLISATEIEYFPIVERIDGLGSELSDYLPKKVRGSITLDNSRGSYGNSRRFVDLLERYTINDQDIEIKYDIIGRGDNLVPASGDTWITSKVSSVSIDRDNDSITLSIESTPLSRRIAGRQITTEDYPNAPSQSLGRYLPITIGRYPEVKAYSLNDSDEWGYATTLSTEHPVGGVNQYFAKDNRGQYVEIDSAASPTTLLEGFAHQAGKSNDIWNGDEQAIGYRFVPSNGSIITAGEWTLYQGSTLGDGGGRVSVFCGDGRQLPDPIDAPGTELCHFTFDEQDNTTSSANRIQAYFNQPAVLEAGKTYWLVIRFNSASSFNFFRYYDSAVDYTYYYHDVDNDIWTVYTGSTAKQNYWALYGVDFTDSTSSAGNEEGLGIAKITADTDAGFSGNPPAINELDLVLKVEGLVDDAAGTFTGGAGGDINETQQALGMLSQSYNGTTWVSPEIDTSTYNSHHANTFGGESIELVGRTEGRTSLSGMVEDILRSSFARLGVTSNGLTLYSYGTKQTSQGRITHANAIINRFSEEPAENSIINRALIVFDQRIISQGVDNLIGDGSFRTYGQSLRASLDASHEWSEYIGRSETLYGARELANNRFNWIANQRSARYIARYLFAAYARYPVMMVDFEVPFEPFSNIDVFQVWELVHPDLPSFFGTSYGVRQETYQGGLVSKGGEEEFRAKSYRIFIESKKLQFGRDEAPSVRIKARILLDDLEEV